MLNLIALIRFMVWDIVGQVMFHSWRLNFRLRWQLLFVSLSLFAIPWLGYQYLQEMENFLRQSQAQTLLARAQVAAVILSKYIQQLPTDTTTADTPSSPLYAYPLRGDVQLDGYPGDWELYVDYAKAYTQIPGMKTQQIIATYQHYLYISLQVEDKDWILQTPSSYLQLYQNDQVQLNFKDQQGILQRYVLTSTSPGWMSIYHLDGPIDQPYVTHSDSRLKAEWQAMSGGYSVEIQIPLAMLGHQLSWTVIDVDDPKTRQIVNQLSSAKDDHLNPLIVPSLEMQAVLQKLGYDQARTWLLDRHGRMLAVTGDLKRNIETKTMKNDNFLASLLHLLYSLVLPQPVTDFKDANSGVFYLQGAEISKALQGEAQAGWHSTPDQRAVILSVAYPVYVDHRVYGVVFLEQTNHALLLLQNQALEQLLNRAILVIGIMVSILLAYATYLSSRIRYLCQQTDNVVLNDQPTLSNIHLPQTLLGDELDDLSKGVANMLERLQQYTRYLQTMASKLSHELRTPLAVVRSSLDNLAEAELPDDAKVYHTRAKQGVERLATILTSMSEATRLEQMLQGLEFEIFDWDELLSGCVAGYQSIYPQQYFELVVEPELTMSGVPDLLVQMLDKLIANAVDFCEPDSLIKVNCEQDKQQLYLIVENRGPRLPDEMQSHLFDSMVSIRQQTDNNVHLGLGLYIVRMIAEFHHAKVVAENSATGVCFKVIFPIIKEN